MNQKANHLRLWRSLVPAGLALIGFGVSVVGYAAQRRILDGPLLDWVFWGTLGLVILNSGATYFGEAVKHRALYELGGGSAK